MKKTLMTLLAATCLGLAGCNETKTTKEVHSKSTPEGEKKVEKETTVKTSDDGKKTEVKSETKVETKVNK